MAGFLRADLDFEINESPFWRQEESLSTTKMLDGVTNSWERESGVPASGLRTRMRHDFVWMTCVGEDVGPRTQADVVSSSQCSESTRGLEAFNIYEALYLTEEMHKDMDKTGFLTYQQVLDLHGVLMKGVHRGNGTLRTSPAYTTRGDTELFFYPSADCLENRLYAIIDCHNSHMVELKEGGSRLRCDCRSLFKCAAWLCFNFVDLHPFSDGNGRMCRLLANYVLGFQAPFPVALREEKESRDCYIDTIIRCSQYSKDGLGDLAAMLIEGAWIGLKG